MSMALWGEMRPHDSARRYHLSSEAVQKFLSWSRTIVFRLCFHDLCGRFVLVRWIFLCLFVLKIKHEVHFNQSLRKPMKQEKSKRISRLKT